VFFHYPQETIFQDKKNFFRDKLRIRGETIISIEIARNNNLSKIEFEQEEKKLTYNLSWRDRWREIFRERINIFVRTKNRRSRDVKTYLL